MKLHLHSIDKVKVEMGKFKKIQTKLEEAMNGAIELAETNSKAKVEEFKKSEELH